MSTFRIPRPLAMAATMAGLALACSWFMAGPSPTGMPTAGSAEASDGNLSLTIYNEGTALVRDRRQFQLVDGINEIAFGDVAAMMDPTSVLFRSITDPQGTWVLEQNYQYDLVGVATLLQKYLGQQIRVVTQDGRTYEGTLLSGQGDIILQGADGQVTVVTLANVQDFSFPELPEGLIVRPTLMWRVEASQAGRHDVELTYLTGGISWQADYVLLLSSDDDAIDLDGWVTITNNSGTTYPDAQVKLIAGDLQRLRSLGYAVPVAEYGGAMPTPAAVEQREFFEYHLYELPRPVTVRSSEIKQIEFVSAAAVPAEKFFVYDGLQCGSYAWYCYTSTYPQTDPSYGVASNPRVMVMLEFDTEDVEADLPRGRVRVYQEDVDGAALLIGEDTIDHTPRGEHVRLYVGDAFDIIGERVQTSFSLPSSHSLEEGYDITLNNHKDEAVEIRVVEHLSRWSEWQVLSSTADYTQLDSSTIEFRIRVPADGEVTLHYDVRYTWPY